MKPFRDVPRRESWNGEPWWMMFECGAGSRWTSTVEDHSGSVCSFSGCNCGTVVAMIGATNDRTLDWFGLRAGARPDFDALVKKNSAFETMDDLLNAKGGYFPSCYVFRREMKLIADEYDRRQEARGDNRRAFRHFR